MPNRQKDDLFQLIKSLGKGEKRNFKLYMQRNSATTELKVVQLFDALDRMEEYDEPQLLKKHPAIAKQQLSNLKASLYRHILASLRLLKDEDNLDLTLHELLDNARILYNKGLYLQCLKVLERLKQIARQHYQFTYVQQAIFFERKIEAMYITRSMEQRADELADESDMVQQRLATVNRLSNLSLQLYSWYIKHGHARNKADEDAVDYYFKSHSPAKPEDLHNFYEKLYLYQSHCWLSFIKQDFLTYYRYAQKWTDLFHREPVMITVETIQYIKGMHNLLGAHYDLKNRPKFFETLARFEGFYQSSLVQENNNYKIQTFIYLYTSKIHRHFLEGTFTKGQYLVSEIDNFIEQYGLYIDRHRVLVFYYKIACLYFGSGNYDKTIDYLNLIIHQKIDLRIDLQCYARLLHLIAHFELGSHDLLPYLAKSVYRFMSKMENLSALEEAMFAFLRESFHMPMQALKPKLEKLLFKIRKYENKRSEARAFAYLDVVSWIEAKLEGVTAEVVIRRKYEEGRR
jgi:hypothetical protein